MPEPSPSNGFSLPACPQDHASSDIQIATYNIQNGLAGGLKLAARAIVQENIDIFFVHEVKYEGGVYT